MRRHVRAALLAMAVESARLARHGVAPEPLLLEMTFGVFARCFFGIGPDDPRFGRLRELVAVIDLSNRDARAVERALDELAGLLRLEAHSGVRPDQSRPPSYLGGAGRQAPDLFDDLTAIRNLIYIMQASWMDTAGLVFWLFKELTENPGWTRRVASERPGIESPDNARLSVRCVRETLRLHQSEYLYRKVLEDIPVGDFVIPEGWLLRVCVRESHRDPRVFANPDEFNPDRFLDRKLTRAEYSTFGASRIACLGEHLTLTLGRVFVEEMAAAVETASLRDGPREYRRWHWKPSSRWRVRVARRG